MQAFHNDEAIKQHEAEVREECAKICDERVEFAEKTKALGAARYLNIFITATELAKAIRNGGSDENI